MCEKGVLGGVRRAAKNRDRRRRMHVSPARGELLEADILTSWRGGCRLGLLVSLVLFPDRAGAAASSRSSPLGGVKLVNIRCSRTLRLLTAQHQLSTHARPTTRVSPPIHHAICPPADPAARRFTCHRPQHHKISDLLSKELQKSSSLCSNQACDRSTYTHIFG
jgi:hypothetical protein